MHHHFGHHRHLLRHAPHRGPEGGHGSRWGMFRRRGPWREFDDLFGPEGAGRPERMERGVLRYLILDALTDGPKHGYEVIKRLEERTQRRYTPSPGTVYPTLQLLEDQALVQAASADGRKVYALTDAGRAELAGQAELVATTLARFGGQPAAQSEPHEAAFLRDELHDLTRTVGMGLQAASTAGDAATLRRIRQAVERCKDDVRAIIAGSDEAAPPPAAPGEPGPR